VRKRTNKAFKEVRSKVVLSLLSANVQQPAVMVPKTCTQMAFGTVDTTSSPPSSNTCLKQEDTLIIVIKKELLRN